MINYQKEAPHCVIVNIYAKCKNDDSWKKEGCPKKGEGCVEVNIFVECDEDCDCCDK